MIKKLVKKLQLFFFMNQNSGEFHYMVINAYIF